MSIESDIADVFQRNEWTWSTTGGMQIPDEDDIQAALDMAAEALYNLPVGAQVQVGRLIVIKQTKTHDVYIQIGEYQ